jgi:HAD superfamily hydrolase (TIGR01549 family)
VLSDRDAAYKLDALGLQNIFTSVYVGEALGFVKPHPELFKRIASDFEVPTSSILHIGDRSETDERAAQAAGCRSLIFGRDFMSFHDIQIA